MSTPIQSIRLSQKPCVVQSLDRFNKFLVGTYELLPSIEEAKKFYGLVIDDQGLQKVLESINNRAGQLVIIGIDKQSLSCSIEYEFDCNENGGVFEFKLLEDVENSVYKVYVAHSNGSVGFYEVSCDIKTDRCSVRKISTTQVIGSKMLTTIDIIQEKSPSMTNCNPVLIAVGDSIGCLTILSSQGTQIRQDITQGDSIWRVRLVRLDDKQEKLIVIVGAENSSWYLYEVRGQSEKLDLLYRNSYEHFNAGVTSITVLGMINDPTSSPNKNETVLKLLLGSYDETLHSFRIVFKREQDRNSKPVVTRESTLTIDDGGVWQVKLIDKRQLCIAAMYAGSYVVILDDSDVDNSKSDKKCLSSLNLNRLIDLEKLELKQKPLHYDVDVSIDRNLYCIVDFNNNLCLLLKSKQN